jgi:5-(carboxyamino)imidazole ribonucleotide synthase
MSKIHYTSQQVIGILGAGQLARMSAQKAQTMGFEVAVYAQKDHLEPACQVTQKFSLGALDDEKALIEFAKSCDVLTLENEFIDADLLERVEQASGTAIYPSPKAFQKIQSKISEKDFFDSCGIKQGSYRVIKSEEELVSMVNQHAEGLILKASKGGYDGYGNISVSDTHSAKKAFQQFQGHQMLAEVKLPLKRELAITAVSNGTDIVLYPIVETVQENHICTHVIAPAAVTREQEQTILKATTDFMKKLNTCGIFSLEFFELESGDILINESAPRPHNSAHYTLNGSLTDQFENHIRAIMCLPLGQTDLSAPYTIMVNLLGTREGEAKLECESSMINEKTYVHLYGKKESRPGRKMGHVNLVGSDIGELLDLKEQWIKGYQL